jgi:hypothetical protein
MKVDIKDRKKITMLFSFPDHKETLANFKDARKIVSLTRLQVLGVAYIAIQGHKNRDLANVVFPLKVISDAPGKAPPECVDSDLIVTVMIAMNPEDQQRLIRGVGLFIDSED